MSQATKTIVIPDQPRFSLADIAFVTGRHARMVNYWRKNGKLTVKQDFRGRDYVERQDLIEFVRDYLRLPYEEAK